MVARLNCQAMMRKDWKLTHWDDAYVDREYSLTIGLIARILDQPSKQVTSYSMKRYLQV